MKKTFLCRYVLATVLTLCVPLLTIAFSRVGFAQEKTAEAPKRIGVYDSRSVAIAFAGSPAQEKEIRQLRAERDQAKAAGDQDRVARLEAEGKARQQTAHQQAFSTAPVDDILLCITNALPEIQKSAGVTALVSKWDDATLKKYSGAEQIDVTMKLVDALQPNERQRKSAIEIQKHKPISLEEARRIKD